MNKIFTIGRLATDPTVSEVNGRICTSFSFASDTKRKDEAGDFLPVFYRVSVWGKIGDSCAKFLHKGDKAAISGDFASREYTDTKGKDRYSLEITADEVEFLNEKRESNTPSQSNYANQRQTPAQAEAKPALDNDGLPF